MLSRYKGKTICPECHGTRLKKEAGYVQIAGKSISDLVEMPVWSLRQWFLNLQLEDHEQEIAKRLLTEINNRLRFLDDVGLGYLTLNRQSNTLSGGESQRINLTTSLGSSLVGSLYILDEPSIGLHPRDTENLINVLKRLRDIGNTVVVVEHDEAIIKAADYIVDIGPKAGQFGGEVVFSGTYDKLMTHRKSLTASYLRGMTPGAEGKDVLRIPLPQYRRRWRNYVEVKGAREHNLKNLDVKIPLECFTVVTGVSGSGKSTLVTDIVYPAVARMLGDANAPKPGRHSGIEADMTKLNGVVMVDQDAIGRSSRSNPATYLKIFDYIRDLYAAQPISKQRNYKSGFFSFNVAGGRCEECKGAGIKVVEMNFLPSVNVVCEACRGRRYKEDTLAVHYKGKNINDVLEMPVAEAYEFFKPIPKIATKLKAMVDVGLGYVHLGQSAVTLSGGESQRMKLAAELSRPSTGRTLYILDEPTTGLHFEDIQVLLGVLDRLVEAGNTVIIIEHNLDVLKSVDWLIDMGPEGGRRGGRIVAQGTPEDLVLDPASVTGPFLKDVL
jgi:excinuclease ABC subunit A